MLHLNDNKHQSHLKFNYVIALLPTPQQKWILLNVEENKNFERKKERKLIIQKYRKIQIEAKKKNNGKLLLAAHDACTVIATS